MNNKFNCKLPHIVFSVMRTYSNCQRWFKESFCKLELRSRTLFLQRWAWIELLSHQRICYIYTFKCWFRRSLRYRSLSLPHQWVLIDKSSLVNRSTSVYWTYWSIDRLIHYWILKVCKTGHTLSRTIMDTHWWQIVCILMAWIIIHSLVQSV